MTTACVCVCVADGQVGRCMVAVTHTVISVCDKVNDHFEQNYISATQVQSIVGVLCGPSGRGNVCVQSVISDRKL